METEERTVMTEERTVTVRADDLFRLLAATGVMRNIARAIEAMDNDPQVQTGRLFEESFGRLNAAHSVANRNDYHPDWDKPVDDMEIGMLDEIARHGRPGMVWTNLPALRGLRVRGMVEIANKFDATFWAGSDRPELRDQGVMLVRLTARGEENYRSRHDGAFPEPARGAVKILGEAPPETWRKDA